MQTTTRIQTRIIQYSTVWRTILGADAAAAAAARMEMDGMPIKVISVSLQKNDAPRFIN
jgi:hypothetical protein